MRNRFVAFLRGINVGGHHKVPMADLRNELQELGFENIVTLLNSGNVIFDSMNYDLEDLEILVSNKLEKTFEFPVPTIIRKPHVIYQLFQDYPFRDVKMNKDIRLYVSFLKNELDPELELPWTSSDHAFKIIERRDKAIFSVLDLSITKTPKAMHSLEQFYGKDITTRNWKTIERIINKLQSLS